MSPGYPTCRRSPRGSPPPCPPASAPAGAAPPRPSGAGWRAVTWPPGGSLSGAFPQRYSFRRQLGGPRPPAGAGHVPDHAPRRVHRQAAVGRMVDVGPGHEGVTAAAQRVARLFRRHDPWPGLRPPLWPLSTTVLPTSARSSGVRSDTLSTSRRYSYPSHDPWPGLRPPPDRDVLVRRFLKPVEGRGPSGGGGPVLRDRTRDPASPGLPAAARPRGGRWRARPGEGRGGPTETGRARLRNSLSPVGRRGEAPQGGRARAKASAGVR